MKFLDSSVVNHPVFQVYGIQTAGTAQYFIIAN